ncbi:DMT family transporter [Fulvimarina endophytica]|uniref:DMT family transporter n=1 Tax=Fulvimarina endophytica TaxID=2293836 RepID=A0A371X1P8_9HYPH|nr:DMT family transporter [Fulvimarina endophytica]RFC63152.1 DMT family transporter [Fulvimarina endophytica]
MVSHPYVLLALTTLFWGGNAVAGKLAAGHVSPMLLTLMRWTFACCLMAPFAIAHVRAEWPIIRRHLVRLFLLGACGFTLFNASLYLALNYTTAINATIEQSSMPLVVFVLNFLLFRTRVTPYQVAGFGLTLVGVALTASHGDVTTLLTLSLNVGDAIMLFGVLVYGAYTVALRVKPDLSWQSTIFCLSVAAFLASILAAGIEYSLGNTIWPDLTGTSAALYTAIFPALIAQSLYIKGVEAIGPNRANLFVNLVPIYGAGLAVLILGETLEFYHLLALAFVIGGILLAERGGRKTWADSAKNAGPSHPG